MSVVSQGHPSPSDGAMIGRGNGARPVEQPVPRHPDTLVRLALLLFYVGMFFVPLVDIRLTSQLAVGDALFGLSAVALLFSFRPPRRAPFTSAWYLGAAIVTVGGIIASFKAISTVGSVKMVLEGVFVLVVWQWTARQLLDVPRRTQQAMAGYVFGATLSAATAMAEQLLHVTFGLQAQRGEATRAVGLAQQPNIAGITLALGIVLVVGLIFARGFGRYNHRLFCLGVIALGLMFTGSVSGMISALAGLVVLLLRRGIQLRRIVLAALLLLGLYFGGTRLEGHAGRSNLNPFSRVAAATSQTSGVNTVSPRIGTYKAAWAGIQDSPFVGHGLDGQTSLVYTSPFNHIPYPTHNFLLLLWYQGGFLVLLGVIIVMGSAFRHALRAKRDLTTDALMCGAICVLVFSMQSPELFDRWLWVPFVLIMTMRRGFFGSSEAAAVTAAPSPADA